MAKRRTAVADGIPAETPNEAIPAVVEQPARTNGTHTPPEVPPEPSNGNRPSESFSVPCGGGAYIQASVWPRTIRYEGNDLVVYSVTVRKSYRDAATNEWKNTQSFRGSELYCVHYVLQRAGDWILSERTTKASELPF